MFSWLFVSASERRLLPGGRFHGPTPYIIGIMTFAMLIIAAAGLALANAARIVGTGAEYGYSLQVPPGAAEPSRLAEQVRALPGVRRVELVPAADMVDILERWLGPSAREQDLPIPALVDFDLAADSDERALVQRIERLAPSLRVIAHRSTVAPVLHSLRALKWLALAMVVLMAAATAAAVVLAARGALDTHRSTIEVMHGIGATDLQVTQLFQRKIALDSLAGALAGSLAAILAMLVLGSGAAALAEGLSGTPPLGGIDLLVLALVPVAVVLLATGVARLAVLAALRRAL